ncbi:MAG: FAD-dependent oxidoreductase [Woeseiaceae bacterium]
MSERIVIIGGGFAGAFTARYLKKYASKDSTIELINPDNYFVFQPLLPEVASGTISAPDAVTPLRQLLPGVKFRMATVTAIDRDRCSLTVLQGSHRKPQQVGYDQLVIAVGQKTNLEIAPGFPEHALCMRNLADAHELRNKVIRRLEHADITTNEPLKRRLLTYVVAGGGFSGVETIGEISEMIRRALRFYPNIAPEDIRAVLVQAGPQILPELPAKLGEYATRILRERNIEIIFDARVASATANAVFLDDGTRIDSCLLVSTVGNGPRDFTANLDVELERGKIVVDKVLRAEGQANIWALGDAALVPLADDQYAPPTAQFAVREARCLARNLAARQKNTDMTPFEYVPKGSLASIGNYKGVAEVYGIRFSSLLAWMSWRFLYIGMLPGFSTRLRVALNWLFDYFLPRSIVQIANRGSPGTIRRRYAEGEVISRPGHYVDGFYTVLSGCLESRIREAGDPEDFVRVLRPGDHWGERSLTSRELTRGTLTATQDTEVLILAADDFRQLRDAFPALDDYLAGISDEIYAPSLRGDDR